MILFYDAYNYILFFESFAFHITLSKPILLRTWYALKSCVLRNDAFRLYCLCVEATTQTRHRSIALSGGPCVDCDQITFLPQSVKLEQDDHQERLLRLSSSGGRASRLSGMSQNPLFPVDERLSRCSMEKPTLVEVSDPEHKPLQELPNMWSLNYIGLYSQYAAVGLLYGSTGALLPFCVYVFDGPSNVCANAKNIVTFAWNIKIFFAILTDTYRPFGMRRKPWMIAGWCMVLVLLLVLAATVDKMSISVWLVTLMLVQGFAILSDVPADGYSVEIASLEKEHEKGQILATGQRVRFTFCIVAGVIQTFLLNGPSTNDDGCAINFQNCWSWGLSINAYYGLLFAVIFVLTVPIFWLKELDATNIPQHSGAHFFGEIWDTLKNLTTFYLIIYVIGIQGFTNFTSNANIQLQYYVIKLTNFQAGIDTITTYSALVFAIWLFQRFMINRDWHLTQYASVLTAAGLGLVWIAPYYNAGGTQDPWFTIFIDLDTYFAQGLSQVLYSMAVIELAKPGQEATTYELIVTVGNAALLVNGVVSTQLLTPFRGVACNDDDNTTGCGSNTVDTDSPDSFKDSGGPWRFTQYCLVLQSISIASVIIFARFLPRSKQMCRDWKLLGEELGTSEMRGRITLAMVVITLMYGIVGAILLLDVDTACLPEVGGSGCE